jgi:hypothetical protein
MRPAWFHRLSLRLTLTALALTAILSGFQQHAHSGMYVALFAVEGVLLVHALRELYAAAGQLAQKLGDAGLIRSPLESGFALWGGIILLAVNLIRTAMTVDRILIVGGVVLLPLAWCLRGLTQYEMHATTGAIRLRVSFDRSLLFFLLVYFTEVAASSYSGIWSVLFLERRLVHSSALVRSIVPGLGACLFLLVTAYARWRGGRWQARLDQAGNGGLALIRIGAVVGGLSVVLMALDVHPALSILAYGGIACGLGNFVPTLIGLARDRGGSAAVRLLPITGALASCVVTSGSVAALHFRGGLQALLGIVAALIFAIALIAGRSQEEK